jgi:hypothetical protein
MGDKDDPGAKIRKIRGRYMGMAHAKQIRKDSWEIMGRSGPDTGDSGRYKRSGGDTQRDLWEIKKIWVRDVERSREIYGR